MEIDNFLDGNETNVMLYHTKDLSLVDAIVTAGGTIEIYGNPETVKENSTFGGSIVVKQ